MPFYVYLAVMALTTYLVRMLPLTLFQKPIRSRFLRSFLAYVPCACLAAMTFPAILTAGSSAFSGAVALAVAVFLAAKGKGLVTVAVCSCITVFICDLLALFFWI